MQYPLVVDDAVVGIGDVTALRGVLAEGLRLEGQVAVLTEDVEVLIGRLVDELVPAILELGILRVIVAIDRTRGKVDTHGLEALERIDIAGVVEDVGKA